MSCKYKIGNIEFNSKEEVKEFLTKRENISFSIRKEIIPNTVPNFTAHKQTDRWLGVAFRKVMQLASQENYDGIAIATGQQSADMYSLSQQVDKIDITPQGEIKAVYIAMKNNADDTVFINREGIITESASGAYNGKQAEEVLGKDLTRKILETTEETTLEGEGLEFGGEGMKTFYDKIVPKVVQKEAQRFDKNAKLETVDFRGDYSKISDKGLFDEYAYLVSKGEWNLGDWDLQGIKNDRERFLEDLNNVDNFSKDKLSLGVQPYLPLTQAIKSAVSKGVPMFSLSEESPTLKYQTQDGQVFSDYGKALRNTQGENLEAGINSVSGFKPLFTISTNTNISTTEGMINNLIKSDLLSGEKYLENGVNYYKPQGKSEAKQVANAQVVKDLLQQKFGIKAVKVSKDGFISIIEENKRENISLNGKVVKIADLKKMDFKELKDNFGEETAVNVIANNLFLDASQKTSTKELKEEFIPEDELQEKLKNLLKKFGIKTLAFEEYIKKYQIRNKLPINARALADLANKVIAFKDGNIENDDLVEETSHLIVASIPEEKKANIKRNIHKTKEWGQYSEGYKQIYATEDEVREEILGKVVANSIKEQFQARNTNQTEDSIINKIREFVQEFFDRISAYFQDSFQKELDTLNKAVYNNLMQETLQLDLSKATGVLFNDGQATPEADKLYNQVSKMLDTLRAQSRELAKKYTNSADRAMLNLAEEDLERGEYVKAIATLTKLTSSQVEQIHRSIDNAKQGEMPLSSEENIVAQALKETLLPALSEVALKLDVKKPIELALSKEIDNIITRGGSLQGKVKTARKEAFDQIIEKNIEIYNMTEKEKAEYKELIAKAMSGAQKDTDYVHAHLGSLLLARNPLLNIAGRTIERMNQQKLELAQGLIKRLANAIGTFSNKDLLQLFDSKTMDLVSEVDYKKDEELKNEAKIEILNPLLKEYDIDLVVDQNTDFKTIFKTINNKALEEKFRKEYADWEEKEDVNIYYFKKEYRKAIKEHSIKNFFKNGATLNRENITYSAIEIDAQLRAQSTQIRINGNSKANDAELKKVSKFRQEKSNPRDSEGNLLQGIQENYNEILQKWVIEKDALAFSQITSDEQRDRVDEILGLNHLAYLSQDFHKDKKQELNAQFLAEVDALPEEEKWDFIENNSYISFPKEFFDNFKDNPSIILKLNTLGTLDAKEKLKQIRAKQSLINNVLKEISVYNKPGEVNFVEMESTQKETIKLAQTELENLYSQARKLLPKEEREALNVDNRVNEAYINHLEDSGEDELEFIMKNVTPTSFSSIQDMQSILMGRKSPNKTFENNFSDNLIDEEGKLKSEAKQALIEYGKTKLLPYLKKTEPVNFTELKNSMLASDFIRRTDLISVSPNISYTEKTNENINQDYIENKKLGKPQYSEKWLEKVKSAKYEELFGNNKNPELFKAYTELVDVMKEAIEMQGLTGKRDLFMSPQVRATEIERFTRLTPSAIKQSIQDLIQFRPEEKERGEQTGQGMYTIPNYYNSRLEDPSEITRNVLYSYATYIAKASENKARRENIGDMFVIDEILSSTDLVNKKAQSSQTYKMFKNFKEFNFYGVQESFSYEVPLFGKTVDIGKVLKVMNSWAKKTNLTGLTVPLTSLGQSFTQKVMERVIGQFISPLSANEGNKLFKKHATDAIKEVGGFKSESFLNVTLEALGLYNLTHRYEDSQYSKVGRNLYNLGNKLHEGGNFPVIAPAICGIISDYRYVDGRIIDEKTFKKHKKEGNWSDYDLFSKDFEVAVQNGVLDFKNEKFLNAVNSADKNGKQKIVTREGQTLEEYLEEVRLNISMRSLSFVQQIDSQIPQHQKSQAQRDQRMNFFLSHSSWLVSAIPRRVRNRSFSYAEGEFQEGSWRTVWELLQNSKGNPKKMRELYREMDDFQKKNIIRGGAELAFANALGILALVLSNYVDDEDEVPYLVAIADVFATRVATEQIGSTVGLPKSIYQAMSPSIMLKQKMENWLKVNQLFDSEKRNKYIGGLIPFYNDVTRFRDPKTYQNSYFHFQADDGKTFYQNAWLTNFLREE